MRYLLAALLLAHGIAHLPGFAVSWRLLESPELPYATTILGGRLDLGDRGIRAVGLLWLLCCGLFALGALALAADRPGWAALVGGATGASLLLTLCFLPPARMGMAVNLLVLVGLAVATLRGRG